MKKELVSVSVLVLILVSVALIEPLFAAILLLSLLVS